MDIGFTEDIYEICKIKKVAFSGVRWRVESSSEIFIYDLRKMNFKRKKEFVT